MKQLVMVLTVGCILFIFYQGTRTGEVSMEKSNEIVEQIVGLVKKFDWRTSESSSNSDGGELGPNESVPKDEIPSVSKLHATLSYWIRKGAHFLEYLVLAMLLYWALSHYSISLGNRIIYSLFIVLLCAVFDEYFQSFVHRTSSVEDVLIDLSGGMVGIGLIILGMKIWKRKKLETSEG